MYTNLVAKFADFTTWISSTRKLLVDFVIMFMFVWVYMIDRDLFARFLNDCNEALGK